MKVASNSVAIDDRGLLEYCTKAIFTITVYSYFSTLSFTFNYPSKVLKHSYYYRNILIKCSHYNTIPVATHQLLKLSSLMLRQDFSNMVLPASLVAPSVILQKLAGFLKGP